MKAKVYFIEYLRIIAALAVVMIHVVANYSFSYGQIANSQWWASNIIAAATHWAVPIFIMVSGYLNLAPHNSVNRKSFYSMRFKRIGLPLLFWILVYGVYHHFTRQDPLSFSFIGKRLIFDQPYEHLYFLIILLQLAIVTPFLAKIVNSVSTQSLSFMTVGLLFISIFWKPWRFLGPLFVPYLGYYLGGFWLKRKKIVLKNNYLIFSIIVLIALISIGTYLLVSHSSPARNGLYFYTYFNPFTILLSFSIFLLFQNLEQKLAPSKLISTVSKTTFGIYLIHPILVDALGFIYIKEEFLLAFIALFLKSGLVFLIGALSTAIYQRLKLVILQE